MLTLSKVTKRFGSQTVVDNLDLSIPQGLVFGLLGPNGSGKTTLLRMAMGLLQPTSGRITIFEKRIQGGYFLNTKKAFGPLQ